jgi:hypothetical protein
LIGLVPCKLGHVLELYGNRLVQNLFDFSIVLTLFAPGDVLVLVLVAFGGQRWLG